MRRGADVARIFHHVSQEHAKQARIHLVEFFVAIPHDDRLVGIARDIGVDHILDQQQRQMGHARQRVHRPDRRRLRQRDRALGDIGGVIADAFEIAADLQRGNDLAQIARHRLAQRQEADRQIVDVAFELVDLRIAFDDPDGAIAVAFDDNLDRGGQLALRQPAHFDDHVVEALQLLVVALDDVFGSHARPFRQPKRPVM